jgi:heme exporter protein C
MAALAKWILGIATAAATAMTFLYLPAAQGFPSPELARIVALHLPNAMAAVIAAIYAGVYAWRFLAKNRDPLDDARSKIAGALAAIFCLLTTVTGMVFAQYQWGAPWNWDPKQTAIFVLLLIYAAYFVLRAGIEDPEKRGTVAAVYMLFAAVTNTKFDPAYHTVIWFMSACMVGIYAWLQNIAVRYERVRLLTEAGEA